MKRENIETREFIERARESGCIKVRIDFLLIFPLDIFFGRAFTRHSFYLVPPPQEDAEKGGV